MVRSAPKIPRDIPEPNVYIDRLRGENVQDIV